MKKINHFLCAGMLCFLLSCGASNHTSEDMISSDTSSLAQSPADGSTPLENVISSSAAQENKRDTVHKFIRTAELKFKVKDVPKATYEIEDIVRRFDGFVTFTRLQSTVDYTNTIAVSRDSSVLNTFYTVENDMILRVPNTTLDSTLKSIAAQVDFLDYRIIKADDVALDLLANSMTQSRLKRHEKRLTNAIDRKGKELWDVGITEEDLLNRQERADQALINKMDMMDRIRYSTVQLKLYQRQSVKQELISNGRTTAQYEPHFGIKALESLETGWNILEAVILFLMKSWSVILIIVILVAGAVVASNKLKK